MRRLLFGAIVLVAAFPLTACGHAVVAHPIVVVHHPPAVIHVYHPPVVVHHY